VTQVSLWFYMYSKHISVKALQ